MQQKGQFVQLNAICYPKGGPSMGFAVPVTGRNAELLRQVASRIKGLEEGRRNLKATSLQAEEYATDRLSVIPQPSALSAVGFDFNKVYLDCSSSTVPNALFCDTRRERTLRINMSAPDIEKLAALDAQDIQCAFCSDTLTEAEIMKGDGTCSPCVVSRT